MNTMMNIGDYAEKMKEEVIALMPESQRCNLDIRITNVEKVNDQRLVGLTFKLADQDAAPTIYINGEYEMHYLQGEPVRYQAEEILSQYDSAMEYAAGIDMQKLADDAFSFNWETVKDRLSVRLLEIDRNSGFLKDKPFFDVGNGLALVATILFTEPKTDSFSVTINDSIFSSLEVDKAALFRQALANASRMDSAKLVDMEDALYGSSTNLLTVGTNSDDHSQMYLLSNRTGDHGAAALFYPGIMEKAGDIIGCSYYALPSSLHEFILIPDSDMIEPSDLKEMVRQANESVVEPHELLSYNVFYFDKEADTFTTYA